jgi:hypothetical protein
MRLVWFEYTTPLLERSNRVCGVYCAACLVEWNYVLYALNVFEICSAMLWEWQFMRCATQGKEQFRYSTWRAQTSLQSRGSYHLLSPNWYRFVTLYSLSSGRKAVRKFVVTVFWKSVCPGGCIHSAWWQEIENNHGMWPIRFLTDGIFTL